ncbi:MAG: hypothetical protein QNK37_28700, partial [Acidobacteriota bacterium]|nr:hypothetical protein [Acidobacteriota bacterium]
NTSLDDLKVEDLIKQAHQIALQVSNSRAVDCLKLIRAIWNTAKDYADSQGISCPGNPLKLISILKMFKLDRKKIVIPFSHVGRFITHAEDMKDNRDLSKGARLMMRLYLVSLFLGMRNGEARHLKWEYLGLESGYFKLPGHIVENKKTHIKPIGPYAVEGCFFLSSTSTAPSCTDANESPKPWLNLPQVAPKKASRFPEKAGWA